MCTLNLCRGQPPHLTDIGPPCAPWCTLQVGGAQHRSMVHNVVLYSLGGALHRSHKPIRAYTLNIHNTHLLLKPWVIIALCLYGILPSIASLMSYSDSYLYELCHATERSLNYLVLPNQMKTWLAPSKPSLLLDDTSCELE